MELLHQVDQLDADFEEVSHADSDATFKQNVLQTKPVLLLDHVVLAFELIKRTSIVRLLDDPVVDEFGETRLWYLASKVVHDLDFQIV